MATTWAHAPVRSWFGQVLPGSYAPNIDGEGVDGKIAGVAAIRAHDPHFDEDVFVGQAQQVFFVVINAWTSLTPEASQSVMSPLIWQQFKQQCDSFGAQGMRNVLTPLSWTSAIVAGASTDAAFDTVSVRINATSSDCLVDGIGRIVRGTAQPFDWTEDWIFQRPSTAQTLTQTVAGTTCATCGAPVNPGDFSGVCAYCKASISSPFGWMLTRIDRV